MVGSQGLQTVGTPGPAHLQFQTTAGAQAAVWTYDASGNGNFHQMHGNSQFDAPTLEAFIVSGLDHNEHMRVVVDFTDDMPANPGDKTLETGWNFIAGPQYGPAEHAIAATADIGRVQQVYDQPDSQPIPASAPAPETNVFSYPIGANSPGPDLSAYSGYWVYVNEKGTISAVIPSGVTLREEPDLLVTA
ncbi:MAG: hypothetical protein ABEJ59_00845 [Halanaeroarchaeum sp.]